MPAPALHRLLITGAAGGLGRVLREKLVADAPIRRLSDIAMMSAAAENEEVVQCDLADRAGVHALLDGVDAVVHLGGISVEGPFDPILAANIVGAYNLYEAARQHGVQRVVFASSNHVIGFYPQDQVIDAGVLPRPDGYYGISKAFGENLSRFYWDRYAIETVCIRIGSSFPQPRDRRMLITWLSYDDLARLVRRALVAPEVGHTIVYGVSANRDRWWDNRAAAQLGFIAEDPSEPFRDKVEAASPALDRADPAGKYQGGAFVRHGPYE